MGGCRFGLDVDLTKGNWLNDRMGCVSKGGGGLGLVKGWAIESRMLVGKGTVTIGMRAFGRGSV